MTEANEFRRLDIDLITENCANETQNFLRKLASDTRYCFELFRRAYGDLLDEALSRVYDIYLPMLARRARKHPLYFQSCQEDDYFARVALSSFFRVNSGARFEEKFTVLPGVINYLYACLHSAIAEDVRENARVVESPSDDADFPPTTPSTVADRSDAETLWKHIVSLLPEPELQLLARLRFVFSMKPAEIVQLYPQIWKNERDVSVALQLIRRRLRKDDHLRDLAGLGDDSTDN